MLTASTRYSYLIVRTLVGLPLMLLAVSAGQRHQVADTGGATGTRSICNAPTAGRSRNKEDEALRLVGIG